MTEIKIGDYVLRKNDSVFKEVLKGRIYKVTSIELVTDQVITTSENKKNHSNNRSNIIKIEDGRIPLVLD